jgi:hypothetical protein
VNLCRALVASRPLHLYQEDQARGPRSQLLRAPLMRSPAQWPGTVRGGPSAGRGPSTSYWESGLVDPTPRDRVRRALRVGRNAVSNSVRKAPRGNTYRPT